MINHARTLLLNKANDTYLPGVIGEEYMPPYSPVKLPSYLMTSRKILFGTDPDKVFLNFRLHELMNLIHQTELGEFVFALDNRITYDPLAANEFFMAQRQIKLRRLIGLDIGQIGTRLFVTGQVKPDNVIGRAYRNYIVEVTTANGLYYMTVLAESAYDETDQQIDWLGSGGGNTMPLIMPDTNVSGLSGPVPVPKTELDLRVVAPQVLPSVLLMETEYPLLKEDKYEIELELGEDPAPLQLQRMAITESIVVAKWALETYARPDSAITTCLPRLEFLGEPFYLELFGVDNTVEPYATFKNIWFDHKNPSYRLGAFILAMIYRTDAIRKKQDG
jgi:hypothetical protein